MLHLKLLFLLGFCLSGVAAFEAWAHEQARSAQIKQTITVQPDTARAISKFTDR